MSKRSISIILLLTILLTAAGCSAAESTEGFMAMDTYMSIRVCSETADEAALLRSEIERLDRLFSPEGEGSDIARLNSEGTITADSSTVELISQTLELSAELDGALDPTVYPLIKEWGFIDKSYHIPDAATIDRLLAKTGYSAVKVNGSKITIPEGYALDPGAVAKGYAADRCAAMLGTGNSRSALLNLGGTVAAVGKKPNGESWTVGIADPENPADYIGYLKCCDKTVATSGSYERYFVGDDGKTYCHILDPATGCPVQGDIVSVTAISDSGLLSDALSTALFVKGIDGAERLYRERGDFEYVILTKDKAVLLSDGIKDSFTPKLGSGYEIRAPK